MKKFLIIFVAIIVVLVVGRNIIVKFAMEQGAGVVGGGATLKIEKLNLGLTTTQIGMNGLTINNPKGFPKEPMLHAPEIFVDYNLGAFLKGKVHLEMVRVHLDKFVIVKNKDGLTNLEALMPKPKEGQPKPEADKKDTGKDQKAPDVRVDHLSLKVGTVIFQDYSKGGEPQVTEYKVNISEEIDDVMNAQSLFALIASRVLAKTAISSLGNLGVDLIGDAVNVPSETINTILGTTQSITDKIKLPFGNK